MIELLSGAVLAARHRLESPWAVIAFLLLVAGLALYGWRAAAKRRTALLAWATGRKLDFTPGRSGSLEGQYPEFTCLQQGHSRYAFNLIQGPWGPRPMLGFDYHYVTGSGKHRQTHLFSAVILDSGVVLQPLFIRPEGLLDKVSEFFGADDIDFESAEFSRRFYVKAPNKRWAYDVIYPRTMEFLMASPPFKIQFGLRQVICYRDQQFQPADYEAACRVVCGLLDRLPEYVLRQQGTLGRSEQGGA
ncbi:MAG: hypothetical protein MUP47_03660 [Phycisphaerae bacterium]|nr:hypothetical protein [Phycisphaerae bacterium]